jgi:hypothetical protein
MDAMAGVARDGEVIVLRLAAEERPILATFAASLAEMLEPTQMATDDTDPLAQLVGISGNDPVDKPDDPALQRLLPDAYADADGAAEFRRLTDADLRAEKVANLRRILDGATATGGVVRIEAGEVDSWLAGINDIRLVLGERLEITEESEHLSDLDDGDPRLPPLAVYFWLTEIQDSILELLD